MNEAEIKLFAESITRGVFANAQPQKTPEQRLLDDLEVCHSQSELYPIWRVGQVVESLGFRVFFSDSEFPDTIRARLGLDADAPGVAAPSLNAILLQGWAISRLSRELRLHPHPLTAAILLHECGHLLTARESIPTQIEKERRAWQLGRELLEKHVLYGFCSDGAFSILEANARNSYGDRAIVHHRTISGSTYPSLI